MERALEIGKAAEYLVCADLLLAGYRAFLTDQGCPYDVVADIAGRLVRIQVKGTRAPRPVPNRPGSGPSYMFHCRHAGKGKRRIVLNTDFDLLALVALDIRAVAYLPISTRVLQTIHLRAPATPKNHGNKSRGNIDEFTFEAALREVQHAATH